MANKRGILWKSPRKFIDGNAPRAMRKFSPWYSAFNASGGGPTPPGCTSCMGEWTGDIATTLGAAALMLDGLCGHQATFDAAAGRSASASPIANAVPLNWPTNEIRGVYLDLTTATSFTITGIGDVLVDLTMSAALYLLTTEQIVFAASSTNFGVLVFITDFAGNVIDYGATGFAETNGIFLGINGGGEVFITTPTQAGYGIPSEVNSGQPLTTISTTNTVISGAIADIPVSRTGWTGGASASYLTDATTIPALLYPAGKVVKDLCGNSIVSTGAVDKSALKKAINNTPDNGETSYTPDSWDQYSSALSTAQSVYADVAATQSAVDIAASDLTDAFNGLTLRAYFGTLVSELGKAVKFPYSADQESWYTAPTWADLQSAISSGQIVAGDLNSTQSAVDAATIGLTSAESALVYISCTNCAGGFDDTFAVSPYIPFTSSLGPCGEVRTGSTGPSGEGAVAASTIVDTVDWGAGELRVYELRVLKWGYWYGSVACGAGFRNENSGKFFGVCYVSADGGGVRVFFNANDIDGGFYDVQISPTPSTSAPSSLNLLIGISGGATPKFYFIWEGGYHSASISSISDYRQALIYRTFVHQPEATSQLVRSAADFTVTIPDMSADGITAVKDFCGNVVM